MDGKDRYKLGRKEYMRQWKKNNPDKVSKHNKTYRKKNKAKTNARKAAWLKKNPEKRKEYQKKATIRHKKLWREALEEVFGKLACQICGYDKCFAALDFHHRNKEEKKNSPSNMMRWKVTEERINEFKKCDILCANCHREIEFCEED